MSPSLHQRKMKPWKLAQAELHPFYCSMLRLKHRNSKYLCNKEEPKFKAIATCLQGLGSWPLCWTGSRWGSLALDTQHWQPCTADQRLSTHVETTLKRLFSRITEKPFVKSGIKISTDRFYPSPTSHYPLLLFPIALHFRIHG